MSTVLDRIAGNVRERLAARKAARPEAELRGLCARRPHAFDVFRASPGTSVIAEVKFASPSQGRIATGADPVGVAGAYLAAGAAALSVLTEQDHFNGSHEYLAAIRRAYPEARLLMKDFVVDEYQLLEAVFHGADAALLIVALLGKSETARLLAFCRELGLTALVEVHDLEELRVAEEIGASLIGVNNRDLKTLEVDVQTSFRLARQARNGATLVSESGIESGRETLELRKAGFSAFLVGTSFMRTGQPGDALARFLAEAR